MTTVLVETLALMAATLLSVALALHCLRSVRRVWNTLLVTQVQAQRQRQVSSRLRVVWRFAALAGVAVLVALLVTEQLDTPHAAFWHAIYRAALSLCWLALILVPAIRSGLLHPSIRPIEEAFATATGTRYRASARRLAAWAFLWSAPCAAAVILVGATFVSLNRHGPLSALIAGLAAGAGIMGVGVLRMCSNASLDRRLAAWVYTRQPPDVLWRLVRGQVRWAIGVLCLLLFLLAVVPWLTWGYA